MNYLKLLFKEINFPSSDVSEQSPGRPCGWCQMTTWALAPCASAASWWSGLGVAHSLAVGIWWVGHFSLKLIHKMQGLTKGLDTIFVLSNVNFRNLVEVGGGISSVEGT